MHPVPFESRCLKNFSKCSSLSFSFQPGRNVIIGDNESGKSSMLLALNLVLSTADIGLNRWA